jgi:hypothetical protein
MHLYLKKEGYKRLTEFGKVDTNLNFGNHKIQLIIIYNNTYRTLKKVEIFVIIQACFDIFARVRTYGICLMTVLEQ